eukprot:CAMPEP_0169085930 /NCGR_PEP_ID=MMETSP1015-20121227/13426_1 /TAXON_ID=342587 /ORGANISM="Karlodinium micrum, Strain CCMP2283" /LENGTH=409 /DNA_ID=CAMNT_0009146057 /DNA_START=115 /DNA_END=1344 /DNA_ORIENTATION=+
MRAHLPTQRPISRAAFSQLSFVREPVSFVNPLAYDGFAEPNGWGAHEDPSKLPLLCYLPGLDGSIFIPFMQYPELGTSFELACMRLTEGMDSRASFDDLVDACASHVTGILRSGRRVLLVGESFGGCLAVAVAHKVQQDIRNSAFSEEVSEVSGIVLVNPATSFARSTLAKIGLFCASLSGILMPLYPISLLAFAALVLTPATQMPAFIAHCAGLKVPAILNSEYREAFYGRVALSAFLGQRGSGLQIGEILSLEFFKRDALEFRLNEWLQKGAAQANSVLPNLDVPFLIVVGERDRLLPSVDEARRLKSILARGVSCSIVDVPGAGHASTLGYGVNLMDEIRKAFANQESLNLQNLQPHRLDVLVADESEGWARGLLDRQTTPIDPSDYTRYNKGGDLFTGVTISSKM